jgi:hypothetical protein
MYPATRAVASHGRNAIVIRNTTFNIRNACVVRRISRNMWWWLTQMTPIVRKLTT